MINIESDEILNYKFVDGTPIWPMVRFSILSLINKNKNENENENENENYSGETSSKLTYIKNILMGLRYCRISRNPIQIISTTLLNVKVNDKYRNVLDDYYYLEYPDMTFIYENSDHYSFEYNQPRENKKVSSLFDYINLLIISLSKIRMKRSCEGIDDFCENLVSKGIDVDIINTIKKQLISLNNKIYLARFFYKSFLIISNPQLLLVNCASYGDLNALLINEAHKRGVRTAEIQHGAITSIHYAYSCSGTIINERDFIDYLPQTILTYGPYWHNNVKLPINKINVGYAYLNRESGRFNNVDFTPNHFLFISRATVTSKLIKCAVGLKVNNPNYTVTYRTHPSECLTKNQIKILNELNIEISNSKVELYGEINKSEFVVGGYSTVLFEALAFNKKTFVLEDLDAELSGLYDFTTVIKSWEDINCNLSFPNNYSMSSLWTSDFSSNYNNYINETINI
ncbi:Putative uncharacterized protein [Moritella viscosa]|uniref:hypothetical protein n=1 Tax=Moritella viscosa TaxID=80854 RepID=UPI0009104F19|nr:hypothetical protein [Moritella viscosa]SGY94529.1 Putative uncharacterized protein [Moritella viscosa]